MYLYYYLNISNLFIDIYSIYFDDCLIIIIK